VDRNYLRVLLHRAKHKFKAVYEKEQFGAPPRVTGFGNSRNDWRPSKSSTESVRLVTEG
jgi:hypothetical protein